MRFEVVTSTDVTKSKFRVYELKQEELRGSYNYG